MSSSNEFGTSHSEETKKRRKKKKGNYKMEQMDAFDNYLTDGQLFVDKSFNKKLVSLLENHIQSKDIKGCFFTHYSLTKDYKDHVKIGLWEVKTPSKSEEIKLKIKTLMSDKLLLQSETRPETLYLPLTADKLTGLIACFSLELSTIINDRKVERISEIFYKIASWICSKFEDCKTEIAKYFGIYNLQLSSELAEVESFCKKFEETVIRNAVDFPNSFGFMLDRLFHHCNNSMQVYGNEETVVFHQLVQRLRGEYINEG